MHEVKDAWMEEMKSEQAEDLVEEILDLILFGIEDPEDRKEVERLLEELKRLGEIQAVESLKRKLT